LCAIIYDNPAGWDNHQPMDQEMDPRSANLL
jgi:hypothetical protein